MLHKLLGYDILGYWEFFGADDAPALIEKHASALQTLIGFLVLLLAPCPSSLDRFFL